MSYLRPSKIDGAKHSWAILALLVKRLRRAWPKVQIVFRGDSGFCRWRMLRWCERHGVNYIVGIARNKRLNVLSKPLRTQAHEEFERSGDKQRLFDEFFYAAGTWEKLTAGDRQGRAHRPGLQPALHRDQLGRIAAALIRRSDFR